MELRLRTLLVILLLAIGLVVAAAVARQRLGRGAPGAPTPMASQAPTPVVSPASGPITFADKSATWDWQVTCQDALQAWVQQSPNPIRTIRVTLSDEQNLGVSTIGVGYPGGKDQAAIAYAACDGKPDLACQVAIKQGAPGDDLDVAVTAAIPHAIRNAWLIHAPGGAEQIDAIRKGWSWEQFQPLLQKGGAAWHSSCLTVSKP